MSPEQQSPFRAVLQQISGLAGTLVTVMLNQQRQKEKAINTISKALEQTYLYYKRQETGMLADRDRQEKLVSLWRKAANAMAFVDQDLAETCRMKSQYWIDPIQYSHTEVSRITMHLDTVNEQYRKLLVPRVVRKEERANNREQ